MIIIQVPGLIKWFEQFGLMWRKTDNPHSPGCPWRKCYCTDKFFTKVWAKREIHSLLPTFWYFTIVGVTIYFSHACFSKFRDARYTLFPYIRCRVCVHGMLWFQRPLRRLHEGRSQKEDVYPHILCAETFTSDWGWCAVSGLLSLPVYSWFGKQIFICLTHENAL